MLLARDNGRVADQYLLERNDWAHLEKHRINDHALVFLESPRLVFLLFWNKNRETVGGFRKPWAVLTTLTFKKTMNFHICHTFPEACPTAPGDCRIWRYHFIQPQRLWTHVSHNDYPVTGRRGDSTTRQRFLRLN